MDICVIDVCSTVSAIVILLVDRWFPGRLPMIGQSVLYGGPHPPCYQSAMPGCTGRTCQTLSAHRSEYPDKYVVTYKDPHDDRV